MDQNARIAKDTKNTETRAGAWKLQECNAATLKSQSLRVVGGQPQDAPGPLQICFFLFFLPSFFFSFRFLFFCFPSFLFFLFVPFFHFFLRCFLPFQFFFLVPILLPSFIPSLLPSCLPSFLLYFLPCSLLSFLLPCFFFWCSYVSFGPPKKKNDPHKNCFWLLTPIPPKRQPDQQTPEISGQKQDIDKTRTCLGYMATCRPP